MAITPLPTPPSRDDPTNFATEADAFLGALPDFATEANALAVDVNADAVAAAADAANAQAAAAAATAAANATKWVSGTTYTEGAVVWSPITYLTYRRKTTGGGTTDPSADSTNWSQAAGTGDVTQIGTQTLTNKTLGSGTALSATVTGNDSLLTRVMLQDTGWDFYDSSTTNALDYVNGSVQRWAPNTGAQTLSITNWPPSGAMGELLVQGINLGAATITWPTINWIKSDGTTTTTFSSNGVTLQASGTDWFILWTRDGGTTIYGKFVR